MVKVLDGLLASTEGTSSKGDALLDRFVDRIACHAQLWSSETTSSVVRWCRSSARALQSVRDGVGLDAYAQRLASALSSTHAASTYSYRSPHLSLTVPPSTEPDSIGRKEPASSASPPPGAGRRAHRPATRRLSAAECRRRGALLVLGDGDRVVHRRGQLPGDASRRATAEASVGTYRCM